MSTTLPAAGWIIIMAPAGCCLGFVYFAALRHTADLLTRRAVLPAIAFTVGRGGLALAIFGFSAWLGAGPLLATFAGFLAARWSTVRRPQRTV